MSTPIDEYIAALPAARQARAQQLLALIKSASPKAVPHILWKMPVFSTGDGAGTDNPQRWIAFANRAGYLSVYLRDQQYVDMVVAAHPKIKCGKACLNITDKDEWPEAALKKAIAAALK